MDEDKYSVVLIRQGGSVEYVRRLVDLDTAVDAFCNCVTAKVCMCVIVLIEDCVHLEWTLAEGLRKAATRG